LKKALYRLKQSAKEWNNEAMSILVQAGFDKLIGNEGCYIRSEGGIAIARIVSYVNNYLVIAKTQEELDRIQRKLNKVVKVDNREKPKMFLGLECEIENGKILLIQRLLIEKVTKMYNIKYGAKTLTTKFSNSQISLRQSIDSDQGSHPEELVADKIKYQ
jgi:hypothetical protein